MPPADPFNEHEAPPKKKQWTVDLANPGFVLVFWDIVFGIPFCYIVTSLVKITVAYLDIEEAISTFYGDLGLRMLFVLINVCLVITWAGKIGEERRKELIAKELKFWDAQIEKLEREKVRIEERELQAQLLRELRSEREMTAPVANGNQQAWGKARAKLLRETEKSKMKGFTSNGGPINPAMRMRTPKIEKEEL